MTEPTPFAQSQYQVRFDWGLEGAREVGKDVDVIVIVDVLSWSTSVELAVSLGAEVIPASLEDAADLAARYSGVIAGPRSGGGLSLSPQSITAEAIGDAGPIILPSPNGSMIAASLAAHPAMIVAGSLRNRTAVASWALNQQGDKGERFTIAIIAAGEARQDRSTRFAVEDLLGAGAVIDALADVGIDYCSPEAAAASAAFTGLLNATGHLIGASGSGRELAALGYRGDIDLAIDIDVSSTVPVLRELTFRT